MIYLLRKHGIISVPSYAVGIYHPPKVDIISKIYHPFREERISLKTPSLYHNEGVFMVEAGGVEPPSENNLTGTSPGAVDYLHSLTGPGIDTLAHLVAS